MSDKISRHKFTLWLMESCSLTILPKALWKVEIEVTWTYFSRPAATRTASMKFWTFTEKVTISFWYSCETRWSFLISCTSFVNVKSGSPKRSCNVDITLSGDEALISKSETASFAGPRRHLRNLHQFSLSLNFHTSVDSSYACLYWSHSRGSLWKSGKTRGVQMRLNRPAFDLWWAVETVRFLTADASIWIVPSVVLAAGATNLCRSP